MKANSTNTKPVNIQALRAQHASFDTIWEGMQIEEGNTNVLVLQTGLKRLCADVNESDQQIIIKPSPRQKDLIKQHLFDMDSDPDKKNARTQLGLPCRKVSWWARPSTPSSQPGLIG